VATASRAGGCRDAVVFLPAIPRTSTGKFLKSALRASLRGHYGGEAAR